VEESAVPALSKFGDLEVDWAPILPQHLLAARLREADIFILPSIEDGLARTVTEALSCGLPVIITSNTGSCDLVTPGVNGEIVPICDADAIAVAVEKWWEKIRGGYAFPIENLHSRLTYEAFENQFFAFLEKHQLNEN
jgi:glycosyltransferase involved in cell wall biosynthesis